MYTQDLFAPETTTNRSKALAGSVFISVAMLAILWHIRIHASQEALASKKTQLDTLELMTFIPLRVQVSSHLKTSGTASTSRSAPETRFAPKASTARPSPADVKGASRPIVTQTEPSPVEVKKIDPRGLFKKTEHRGSGNDPKAAVNNGGSPNGNPTTGYEGPGQGTGSFGLDLAGYRFGKMSVPKDPYDETGKIVFRIKVSGDGVILALNLIESTVSVTAANWYKQQLAKLTVVPTSSGQRPEISEGRVTINISSK